MKFELGRRVRLDSALSFLPPNAVGIILGKVVDALGEKWLCVEWQGFRKGHEHWGRSLIRPCQPSAGWMVRESEVRLIPKRVSEKPCNQSVLAFLQETSGGLSVGQWCDMGNGADLRKRISELKHDGYEFAELDEPNKKGPGTHKRWFLVEDA